MGKLLPSYKRALYDEMVGNISANVSHYYVFAAKSNNEKTADDDYTTLFTPSWKMLFGKRLKEGDIVPIIKKNMWTPNKVYDRYDNTDPNLHVNGNFYVIAPPAQVGGNYLVYKCIDNANGSVSTVKPNLIQSTTFETSDGYRWRYLSSISYKNFQNISTNTYSPVYTDETIAASAKVNAGVEVVMISNGGSGYSTHHEGSILSVKNSTLLQIDPTASLDNDFYNKSAIYIYNTTSATSQLFEIVKYVSNTSGNWVTIDSPANTQNIIAPITKYKISPKVVFTSDGSSNPVAYSVVNSVSNSIHKVVVLSGGSDITWSNVHIQANSAYGVGANLYSICPPPGGHGSNPSLELDMKGISVYFSFANTQSNTIQADNISYDLIGVVKNPYAANTTNFTKAGRFSGNTFSQITVANLNGTVLPTDTMVMGETSNSFGHVIHSNSTVTYIIGDKTFLNSENIITGTNNFTTSMIVDHHPKVYGKDLMPVYIQNINNIQRSNTQTESFNLLIQF